MFVYSASYIMKLLIDLLISFNFYSLLQDMRQWWGEMKWRRGKRQCCAATWGETAAAEMAVGIQKASGEKGSGGC